MASFVLQLACCALQIAAFVEQRQIVNERRA